MRDRDDGFAIPKVKGDTPIGEITSAFPKWSHGWIHLICDNNPKFCVVHRGRFVCFLDEGDVIFPTGTIVKDNKPGILKPRVPKDRR